MEIKVSSAEIAMEILRSARMENTDEEIFLSLEYPGYANYDLGIICMNYTDDPLPSDITVVKRIITENNERSTTSFQADSKCWKEGNINYDEICEYIVQEVEITPDILKFMKK